MVQKIRVVYHSPQGKSVSLTVIANGKQKFLMVSSDRIGHLPSTEQPLIYREGLERARPGACFLKAPLT